MIIQSLILIWLGLALLFTLALGQAASRPTPSPGFPDESSTSGNLHDLSP